VIIEEPDRPGNVRIHICTLSCRLQGEVSAFDVDRFLSSFLRILVVFTFSFLLDTDLHLQTLISGSWRLIVSQDKSLSTYMKSMMSEEFDPEIYRDLNPGERTSTDEGDEHLADKDSTDVMKAATAEDTNIGSASEDGNTNAKGESLFTQSKQKWMLDDRMNDPDMTSALYIWDLHWWTTDDDIRGWMTECGCEDELKNIAFSEHKGNGKSKG
jgi:hypothetical protein